MSLDNTAVVPLTGGAYTIDQSLRFNDDDSAYLSWTPSSAGNRKTYTFSCWVKLGKIGGTDRTILSAGGTPYYNNLRISGTTGQIDWSIDENSSYRIKENAYRRDSSSWYHIVIALDTTQATSSDRAKMYINGEEVTSFANEAYPAQNYEGLVNNNVTHAIGRRESSASSTYHDGYLAEVHFIDGTALDASYFGETGDYGEWKPKKYSGSYGTNGFYLPFDSITTTISGNTAQTATTTETESFSTYSGWSDNTTDANYSNTGNFGVTSGKLHINTFGSGSGWHGQWIYKNLSNTYNTTSDGGFTVDTGYFTIDHVSGALGQFYSYLRDTTSSDYLMIGFADSQGGAWNKLFYVNYRDDSAATTHTLYSREWGDYYSSYAAGYDDDIYIKYKVQYNQTDAEWKVWETTTSGTTLVATVSAASSVAPTNAFDRIDFLGAAYSTSASYDFYLDSYEVNNGYEGTTTYTSTTSDSSSNSNTWTVNSLESSDIVVDSPTNNFATLNPLHGVSNATLSEGNLKSVHTSSGDNSAQATFGISSGKWYIENYYSGNANTPYGFLPFTSPVLYVGDSDGGFSFWPNSSGTPLYVDDVSTSWSGSATTWAAGDIISLAIDKDADTVTVYKNGSSIGSYDFSAKNYSELFYTHGNYISGLTYITNFGQDSSFAGNKTAQGNQDGNSIGDFYYTPPSGYLALCTANLSDPDVIPSEHFNTVLWAGNGSSSRDVTGVGFNSDFVWIKQRNGTYSHVLGDAVRGDNKFLSSNGNGAEDTDSTKFRTFVTDGFQVGSHAGVNASSSTYVAWNWKANGSGSSNTDGSITSTVSANQDAGFSIVTYTGTGSSATVGHGLSSAPEVVILKRRDSAEHWVSRWEDISTTNKQLYLNLTNAVDTNNISNFNSSTFTVDTWSGVNGSGATYVGYCFHSIDGFSKVGSYTGNGSSDGTFVHTGFKPAFVLFKTSSATGNWQIMDKERLGYNGRNELLVPNGSYSEDSGATYPVDIVSNGFKMRDSAFMNGSGVTHIYIAFAENPFKYTNAR